MTQRSTPPSPTPSGATKAGSPGTAAPRAGKTECPACHRKSLEPDEAGRLRCLYATDCGYYESDPRPAAPEQRMVSPSGPPTLTPTMRKAMRRAAVNFHEHCENSDRRASMGANYVTLGRTLYARVIILLDALEDRERELATVREALEAERSVHHKRIGWTYLCPAARGQLHAALAQESADAR